MQLSEERNKTDKAFHTPEHYIVKRPPFQAALTPIFLVASADEVSASRMCSQLPQNTIAANRRDTRRDYNVG